MEYVSELNLNCPVALSGRPPGARSTERRPNGARRARPAHAARDRRRAVRPAASGRPLETSRGPHGSRRPHGSHWQPPGCPADGASCGPARSRPHTSRRPRESPRRGPGARAAPRLPCGWSSGTGQSERMGRRPRAAHAVGPLIGSAVRAGRSAARWRPLLRGCPNHVFIV